MRQAIIDRISRRTYTGERFSQDERETIEAMVAKINEASGLCISYLEDGSDAFASMKKTYGMFKNVRSLLVMKGDEKDENLFEKVGYYGEEIILDLTDMGIGTCWVGGTFDREKITADANEQITCVIVIGKIEKVTFKEKMLRNTISKKRKSVEERLRSTVSVPQWLHDTMEAVRLAPSAVNSQKPMFYYDGNVVTADVANDYAMDLIDLGIAKKHFEEGAGGRFDLGIGAQWHQ